MDDGISVTGFSIDDADKLLASGDPAEVIGHALGKQRLDHFKGVGCMGCDERARLIP